MGSSGKISVLDSGTTIVPIGANCVPNLSVLDSNTVSPGGNVIDVPGSALLLRPRLVNVLKPDIWCGHADGVDGAKGCLLVRREGRVAVG